MNLDKLKSIIHNMDEASKKLKQFVGEYNNIIIIGNGGSNAIASHIAQDYTKVLGKQAFSFSDSSRLTCYMNDYGIEDAYKMFLKHFASPKTLIILVSSSGNSENIINAAEYCKSNNFPLIKLSGFDANNKLNKLDYGLLSYYVDNDDYGVVECAHQIFLHSVI